MDTKNPLVIVCVVAVFAIAAMVFINQKNPNSEIGVLSDVLIESDFEEIGNTLAITTYIKNNDKVTVKDILDIYVKDGIGQQFHVDTVDINLKPGETLEPVNLWEKLGEPPYEVVTSWK